MPAQPQQSSWYRNRWWLPVLLAILVAALVVGVVFGGRIKNALSSPTATPTPAPTATPLPSPTTTPTPVPVGPGTPSPTPIVGGAATATPSGGSGESTPLPGATPFPTVPGVRVGEVTRTQAQVNSIQAGANRKDPKYTYYLNPVLVVQKNLPFYGFTQPFQVVSPPVTPTPTPYVGELNRHVVKTVVSYQNRRFEVYVAQPGKQGPTGIWVIITIKQVG
jgi:hypothetical protein